MAPMTFMTFHSIVMSYLQRHLNPLVYTDYLRIVDIWAVCLAFVPMIANISITNVMQREWAVMKEDPGSNPQT